MSKKDNDKTPKKKVGRPKGLPKTGGKKKGSTHKRSGRLEAILRSYGFDHMAEFMKAFDQLENPKDKIDAIKTIIPYLHPKLNSTEYIDKSSESDNDKSLEEKSDADLIKLIKK